MAIDTTATGSAPYYDDYSDSGNANKNYLRILFQPGRSVQVRELNQIQSGIQDQIDKFGQHMFVDGTPVLGGEIDTDNKIQWLDLTLTDDARRAATDINRPLIGKRIYADAGTSTPSNSPVNVDVSATIMDYELVSGNKYRFYLRYDSSATDFDDNTRQQANVKVSTVVQQGGTTYVNSDTAIGSGTGLLETGYAVKLHNNEGVYFVKGYFVHTNPQTKYVDVGQQTPYNSIDGSVGFLVVENTVNAVNDNTLYDNAAGTSNQSAPGADRYTITLQLCLITDDTQISGAYSTLPSHIVPTSTNNAVAVVSLNQSEVTQPTETKYNKLGDTLATRTFEESGDYALQPFQLDIREHFNSGFNRGKYLSSDSPQGDSGKMVIGLEPSIAYVKGKRIEILKKQEIVVSKGRDNTNTDNNVIVQASQGAYIECTSITNLPKTDANSGSPTTYNLGSTSGATDVGDCKIRGIEYTGRRFRVYISALNLDSGKKLSDAKFINGTGQSGTFEGTTTFAGGFILEDIEGGSDMVFALPRAVIKTLTSVTDSSLNTIKIPIRSTATGATVTVNSGTATIALPQLSGSQYYQDNPNDYIVANDQTGAQKDVASVSITNSGLDCTLTLATGHGFSNGNTADVTHSFKRNATKMGKTKQFVTGETITSSAYAIGDTINLANDDVIRITSITGATDGDLADNFVLDSGQTASTYGVGKLICTKAISSAQVLTVAYVALNHTNTGNDAFWVDSYNIADNAALADANDIQRAEVPYYRGVSLLDCIDFRGSNISLDPNGLIEFGNIQYYLPREDKVVLKSTGEFEYIEGDPQTNEPPKTPENSMLLYELGCPAYIDSVQEIEVGYIDNRRYTMRDIGKIDKRVKNLEYYSSLSLLEQMTKDQKVLDDTTIIDRFKHGIVVDEFKGHSVGDPTDPGYRCAIEPEKGLLRPSFSTTNLGITLGSVGTGNTAADDMAVGVDDTAPIGQSDIIRLNSTSVKKLIEQPFASVAISVNPFDVASWVGDIDLSPATDEWRDTNRRPEVVITQDSNAEAILGLVNEQLASEGIRWNDWNTTWSGVTETTNLGWHKLGSAINQVNNGGFGTTTTTRRSRRRWWRRSRKRTTFPMFNGGTVTVRHRRRARVQLEQRTITTHQTREGIQQFAEIENVRESLGDRVVDVSFVPFIRSRRLYFRGKGLKPNTRVYPYFDGVDVSGYVKTGSYVEFRDDSTRQDHSNDSPGNISADTLVTNDSGTITGYLIIPNNDILRFRTGEREFILSDNPSNDLTAANTFGKATYTARGLLQTVEEQVLSTRRVVVNERRVTDNRTLTTTQVAATGRVRHRDPLAQTFIVDTDLYPNGVTLKDIDLFFAAAHSTLPVTIHLVPTENGIPTQQMIPFSKVEMYPTAQSAVDAGASPNLTAANATATKKVASVDPSNASSATKFVFDAPIYLKPGVEYAIVVMSNSPDWTLWHSEVGGTDVQTTKRITKNPYTGVALKSANASTWTPDQNKDFKMNINMMNFFESGTSVSKATTAAGYSAFTTLYPTGTTSSAPVETDALVLVANDALEVPGTSIQYTLNVAGSSFRVQPGETFELDQTTDLYGSQLSLSAIMTSTDKHVTPMLDCQRLSLLSIKNHVNNDVTNEGRETHGAADARYVTKPIVLENAADRLDVYMDISRPVPTTDVEVYARFNDATGANAYTKLESATIPVTESMKEVHFRTKVAGDQQIFEKFQIKIVMKSVGSDGSTADSAFVPQIRNFRAIATQ